MSSPLDKIKCRMSSDIPVKWLFAGDSITHGALHTWGWRDYTEHFSERIRYDWNYWRQAIEEKPIRAMAWMNDELHPNNYGHLALVRRLQQQLDLWDPDSNVARLFLP